MAVISKILDVEERVSAAGKKYKITLVRLEDGSECEGYGDGFSVGERVEHFWDDKHQKEKIQKIA